MLAGKPISTYLLYHGHQLKRLLRPSISCQNGQVGDEPWLQEAKETMLHKPMLVGGPEHELVSDLMLIQVLLIDSKPSLLGPIQCTYNVYDPNAFVLELAMLLSFGDVPS